MYQPAGNCYDYNGFNNPGGGDAVSSVVYNDQKLLTAAFPNNRVKFDTKLQF